MSCRTVVALSGLTLALPLVAAQVPRPSPEFVIRLPRGDQQLLTQYRGKVVALEFLMTTCPHCQNASTLLEKMYKEYGARGFQPLGVAFNPMAGMLVPDYVRDFKLTFPVGFSDRDPVLDYLQHPVMERMLVPQLVFIDRKGVIRGQYSGDNDFFKDEEKNMRSMIESLLNEGAERKSSTPKGRKSAPRKTASAGGPRSIQ